MLSTFLDGTEYRFYNHIYAVSKCGKFLRNLTPYSPTINGKYLAVGRQRLAHRMVAECWIPTDDTSKHVHHKDGDRHNNNADNLQWCTRKEHAIAHKGQIGTYARTEETRQKLREHRLGKRMPDDVKQKIRDSSIGIKHNYPSTRSSWSDEARRRFNENHPRNLPCKVLGTIYDSIVHASESTGMNKGTIRKRCISKNFPEYELLKIV